MDIIQARPWVRGWWSSNSGGARFAVAGYVAVGPLRGLMEAEYEQ
jgi:hypothetical protein